MDTHMMGVTYKLEWCLKIMGEHVSGFGSATTKTIEWIVLQTCSKLFIIGVIITQVKVIQQL